MTLAHRTLCLIEPYHQVDDHCVEEYQAGVLEDGAHGIVFFGRKPGGTVRAMDLADAWGALELAQRLSYKSWRGPVGQ